MLVLDTSALSTLMHRLPRSVERLRELTPADVIVCAPAAAEIHFGLNRLRSGSRRREILTREYRRLRDLVRWEDWSEAAAEEFGRQKARLAARGRPIDDIDIAIGSIAITLGAGLATHNAGHFQRLESLVVEDWGPPAP